MSDTDNDKINLGEYVRPGFRGGEPQDYDEGRLIVPIGFPTRDEENARLHPDKNLRQLRASLRRRGQVTPVVVDAAGRVLKGNGTHEAAELEGWTHIWIEPSALDGAEATAYAIADNSTGLSSKWDFERLSTNIRALKELDGTELAFSNDDLGFDETELEPMLAADWTPGAFTGEGNEEPKKEKSATDPHTDLEEGDRADNCPPINVTPNMRETIDLAVERVRLISGDLSISEGRCVELIAADYLSGAPTREQALDEFERQRGQLPAGDAGTDESPAK